MMLLLENLARNAMWEIRSGDGIDRDVALEIIGNYITRMSMQSHRSLSVYEWLDGYIDEEKNCNIHKVVEDWHRGCIFSKADYSLNILSIVCDFRREDKDYDYKEKWSNHHIKNIAFYIQDVRGNKQEIDNIITWLNEEMYKNNELASNYSVIELPELYEAYLYVIKGSL